MARTPRTLDPQEARQERDDLPERGPRRRSLAGVDASKDGHDRGADEGEHQRVRGRSEEDAGEAVEPWVAGREDDLRGRDLGDQLEQSGDTDRQEDDDQRDR